MRPAGVGHAFATPCVARDCIVAGEGRVGRCLQVSAGVRGGCVVRARVCACACVRACVHVSI